MFTILLLECVRQFKGERTLSAIYHLFSGKRSAQTLQDAHMYSLTNYFGILKSLRRNVFDKQTEILRDKQLIVVNDKGFPFLTHYGTEYLRNYLNQHNLSSFNGLKYERMSHTFLLRLQLFIQTVSNMEKGINSFIPITDDQETQQWVKLIYVRNRNKLDSWLEGLYKELYTFLINLSDNEAEIFVDRLTGYQKIGLSKEQMARKFNLSYEDVELELIKLTHQLIRHIGEHIENNPFLSNFVQIETDTTFITNSAAYTYQLYNKGYGIEEIVRIRNLKESTIQDHLVEIAYVDPNFNVNLFLSKVQYDQILKIINEHDTKKLKLIKQLAGNDVDYFQIRLVIATQNLPSERKS
ncbi:helix-turn-helix domain-containing protein [Aquibacillus kalidii]|uniref:helix-turn-helix domain-containing protein n=1 Tax=Aquibacillus kalidii TaxID=2762597 RepID=UPI001648BF48|nr:helix-turn-helix domain-containing protein [Aquibacillus kalidii]